MEDEYVPLVDPTVINCNTAQEMEFLQRIISHIQIANNFYANPRAQSAVIAKIPLTTLNQKATDATEQFCYLNKIENEEEKKNIFKDELVKQVMAWFKFEHFSWVNEAPCEHCKSNSTKICGMDTARTNFEREGMGSRVELYQCNNCKKITRFPRFNNPVTLATSCPRGRCGEWANAFAMIVSSLNICPVRYIADWTDHVWIEIYSSYRKKWVHMDCCENAFDAPLLYEKGWGKKLNYVISISTEEVVDVTKRYTANFEELSKRRTLVSEKWLQDVIANINMQLQIWMAPQKLDEIVSRQKEELSELTAEKKEGKTEENQGRISGSKEWRDNRGESGTTTIVFDASLQEKVRDLPYSFQYNNFENCPMLACLKDSRIVLDKGQKLLRLTEMKTGQTGACWITIPSSKDLQVFESGFTFQINRNGSGADGFAFVIQQQSANAIGGSGGGLGYSNIKSSIAIEFDTYKGYDTCKDPNDNHISIHTAGKGIMNSSHHNCSIACTTEQTLTTLLADGNKHSVRIIYLDNTFFVFVDEKSVLSVKYPIENTIDVSKEFYVGFTAATGGLCEAHDILSWYWKSNIPNCLIKHIPLNTFTSFETANIAGIEKRIRDVNALVKRDAATVEELDLILNPLLERINQKKVSSLSEKEKQLIYKLLKWPVDLVFPVIDILRMIAIYTDLTKEIPEVNQLIQKILYIDPSNDPNKLLSFRMYTNFFLQEGSRNTMNQNEPMFVDQLVTSFKIQPSDKSQTKLAYISIFVNYVVLYEKADCTSNEDADIQLLSGLCELAKEEAAYLKSKTNMSVDEVGNEYYYRLLACIGTLIKKKDDYLQLAHTLEISDSIQHIKDKCKNFSKTIELIAILDENSK